jgi:GDPmannose 4,6-dehydratase
LDATRDWGHASDDADIQWLMQHPDESEEFVIATGVRFSVRDFVIAAERELGIGVTWCGTGFGEDVYDASGECILRVDPRYFRPAEVATLLGQATRAKEKRDLMPRNQPQWIGLVDGARGLARCRAG